MNLDRFRNFMSAILDALYGVLKIQFEVRNQRPRKPPSTELCENRRVSKIVIRTYRNKIMQKQIIQFSFVTKKKILKIDADCFFIPPNNILKGKEYEDRCPVELSWNAPYTWLDHFTLGITPRRTPFVFSCNAIFYPTRHNWRTRSSLIPETSRKTSLFVTHRFPSLYFDGVFYCFEKKKEQSSC